MSRLTARRARRADDGKRPRHTLIHGLARSVLATKRVAGTQQRSVPLCRYVGSSCLRAFARQPRAPVDRAAIVLQRLARSSKCSLHCQGG
jgi:hypothetical protein